MVAHLSTPAYAGVSFWLETCGESLEPRAQLTADVDADVAIVGAGYSGLWTAYFLARQAPHLRIVIVESEIAGYGASGRNGGWCSALFPVRTDKQLRTALAQSVVDIGDWCRAENVDAHYHRSGALRLARRPVQAARLRGEPFAVWLDQPEALARVQATDVLGAAYDPDCATLHPGRLVRGLAQVVERAGVTIHERTPAQHIAPHTVETPQARVHADVVLRATEAWTALLPGQRRTLAPIYSLVLATEPLPAAIWDQIGWHGREALADDRRLIIYAQRTADDRIVFGGRGAPYHFGSQVRPAYDRVDRVFAALRTALIELFPVLRDVGVTHTWGGPIGVPRDFHPTVAFDPETGLGTLGGYVGDGVAASHLAGRTMADLVLGRDSELARLSWVNHRGHRWEPEPLRWAGVNGARLLAAWIDRAEAAGRRAALRGNVLDRLTHH